jgi:hypothetical protein
MVVLWRERVRLHLAMVQKPKAGGGVVRDVGGELARGDWKNRDPGLIGKSLIDFEMKIDPRFFRNGF